MALNSQPSTPPTHVSRIPSDDWRLLRNIPGARAYIETNFPTVLSARQAAQHGTVDARKASVRLQGTVADAALALEVFELLGLLDNLGDGAYGLKRLELDAWVTGWENLGDFDPTADATVDAVEDGDLPGFPRLFDSQP